MKPLKTATQHPAWTGHSIQSRDWFLLGAKSDAMFTRMEYNYDLSEKSKESKETFLLEKKTIVMVTTVCWWEMCWWVAVVAWLSIWNEKMYCLDTNLLVNLSSRGVTIHRVF